MSAGAYTLSKYDATYATEIHPIRVQPETIAASIGTVTNAPPAGALTSPISCSVSRGNRQIGLRARLVRLTYSAANAPAGYDTRGGTITIPALTEAFYNVAIRGASATYLGETMTVQGRSAEVAS
jgi:hypothetical protein